MKFAPEISIATAITHERGMAPDGNGRAEWFMPEDLRRFRNITRGHAVVMAARTFQTVLDAIDKPLPDRINIVVDPVQPIPKGCLSVDNLEEGLRLAQSLDPDEVFVMGDERFYAKAISEVTKLYLTIVAGEYTTVEQFPDYSDFDLVHSETGHSGGYDYDFQILKRH